MIQLYNSIQVHIQCQIQHPAALTDILQIFPEEIVLVLLLNDIYIVFFSITIQWRMRWELDTRFLP